MDNEINLVDEHPEDVKRMLEFVYGGDYWEHSERDRGKPSKHVYNEYKDDAGGAEDKMFNDPLTINVRMYAIANKFGMPGLQKHAFEKVKKYKAWTMEESRGLSANVLLETKAKSVTRQWKRVLNAVESYGDAAGSYDGELSHMLLDRIAQAAPVIFESDKERFNSLRNRLAKNPDLCLELFERICIETRKYQHAALKERKDQEEQAEKFMGMVEWFLDLWASVLKRPRKIERMTCKNGNCSSASILTPKLVWYGPDGQVGSSTIEFVCGVCGAEYDFRTILPPISIL